MSAKPRTARRRASVEFSGAQTLRQAQAAWERLRAALAKGPDFDLKLTKVSEADLSFVQLVEAARAAAAAGGGRLRLAAPAQGRLLEVLEQGGFLGPADPDRTAFWTGRAVQPQGAKS
jgi:hypothetical protein